MALIAKYSSTAAIAKDRLYGIVIAGVALYVADKGFHRMVLWLHGQQTIIAGGLCVIVLALSLLKYSGLVGPYTRYKQMRRSMSIRATNVSLTVMMVLASALTFIPGLDRNSHSLAILFVAACLYEATVILLERMGSTRSETAIILGTGRRAQKAWRELRVAQHGSVDFAGFVGDCSRDTLAPDVRERYVAQIGELPEYLLERSVDVMILATSLRSEFDLTRKAIAVAELFDIRIVCLEDRFELGRAPASREQNPIFSELAVENRALPFQKTVKHVMDAAFAAAALVVLAPLFVLVFAFTKLLLTGPFLAGELRFGYHRRPFRMLSLNTLAQTFDQRSLMTVPYLNAPTTTGKVRIARQYCVLLRNTRLDKLPRLWNVVVGDMSIVGPKPMTTRGLSPLQEPVWADMFRARPGLCGPSNLAAVISKELSQALAPDCSYVQKWTLRTDAEVLGRIVVRWLSRRPVVLVPWITALRVRKSSSSV